LDYEVAAAKYQGKQAKTAVADLTHHCQAKLLVSYSRLLLAAYLNLKCQKLNSVLVSSLPNEYSQSIHCLFFARDGWNRSVVAIANSWVKVAFDVRFGDPTR